MMEGTYAKNTCVLSLRRSTKLYWNTNLCDDKPRKAKDKEEILLLLSTSKFKNLPVLTSIFLWVD